MKIAPLGLHCPECDRRRRPRLGRSTFGALYFDTVPAAFVFECPRGHKFKIRHVARGDRRRAKTDQEWVATLWEG